MRRERFELLAPRQHGAQCRGVLRGARRADLRHDAPANAIVARAVSQAGVDRRGGLGLERAGEEFDLRRIAGKQRLVHAVAEQVGLVGQQIAAHPGPQQFERTARNAAGMIVVGAIVDHERLERLEEQAGGMADPRAAIALVAHDAA